MIARTAPRPPRCLSSLTVCPGRSAPPLASPSADHGDVIEELPTTAGPASEPAPAARPATSAGLAARLAPLRTGRRGIVVPLVLLTLIALGGGALRWHAAGENRVHHLSADEQGYIGLGNQLRKHLHWARRGLDEPFRWAPGAPAMFAASAAITRDHNVGHSQQIGPARRSQVVVGVATILVGWAFVALLVGPWAGLWAAALIAFYPPGIDQAGTFLSEPLGALLLLCGVTALTWAWRRDGPSAPLARVLARYAVAGAFIALACLTRADVLIVGAALPLFVLLSGRVRGAWRPALLRAVVMGGATAVVVAPWVLYASATEHHLVTITDGNATAAFVATYTPGGGTLYGAFHALAPEACKVHPKTCGVPPVRVGSAPYFDAVVARYPKLDRDAALSQAIHDNIHDYVLGDPFGYIGMSAKKLWRLWGGYFLGGFGTGQSTTMLWLHRLLVLLGTVGLVAGLWRSRSRGLAAALIALGLLTAINVVYVAEARANTRMMPLLLAAGVAGWFLAVRGRAGASEPEPASAEPGEPVAS
ncbi:MAG TPA: hypothetical protein VGM33_14185 [Baekduia sp.]